MDNDKVILIGESEVKDNSIETLFDEGVTEIMPISLSKSISLPKSSVRVASATYIRNRKCVLPPFLASEIARYKALDSTYQQCVDIKVNTIVGLGYKIGSKNADERADIKAFFQTPNRNFSETFTSIIKNMYKDFETTKNGYLEYIKSGKTRAIYYLPGKDMYIKPKENANGDLTREVEYYYYIPMDYTEPVAYVPYPADGKTKDNVRYCIHFREGSQDDIFYGKPDTAHLFDLIKQSYLSDQYNINFFSNGGQPAWAVLITGGKLSKKSYEKIKEFIDNNLKGVANAHKMLFLSVPNEKAKITLVPLSKSIDEQFISLSDKVQFRIALKCGVHPKLLGLSVGGNFGGGSAGISDLKLFIETICQPAQDYIEEIINKFLLNEFGIDCEFNFKVMNIINEKDMAMIANIYWNIMDEFGNHSVEMNEVRKEFLNMKEIVLKTERIDKPKNDSVSIKTNLSGDTRTTDNSSLDIGDDSDASNLNPEKNKQ